ncbi:B-cell receptor-associated protein 31 isoform X1 [Ctenocephalides felis]|uniref:B-cell receptor-associated protein 31 isoform X1 n=1 Tax=Ctenocephalides felis TaxID=7515 RepID=UPI000E6E3011|nr:B-cell receptor-associated protein 31 isoform X1 [Ctenocephalides felis]
MSLQWTIIASFLYVEIAIVLLLVLPVASPRRWQSFFKSRFLKSLTGQAQIYFLVLLAILVLFLLDAIREMRKYSSNESHDGHQHLNVEMQGSMRLFRAQRNFYISGFALFLSLVIRRLVTLISTQANLLAQSEAFMRQAESATVAARRLIAEKGETEQNAANENSDSKIKELQTKISNLEKELSHAKKDKEAMVSQVEHLHNEYDNMADKLVKYEREHVFKASGEPDKKDD